MQTIIPLSDGSGLRLTTAKYFTPKGRSIHGKGITPDIIVEVPKAAAPRGAGAEAPVPTPPAIGRRRRRSSSGIPSSSARSTCSRR